MYALAFLFGLATVTSATELDRETYRRKIRENFSDFKVCYEEGLKKQPALEGKIVLDWYIDGSGAVTRAIVKSSTVKDEKVGTCMVDKLKTIKFPAPPEGTEAKIEYPFVFSPKK